jgi:effector-binding domain-containing protein
MDYEIIVETVMEQPIAAAAQRATFRRISKEIGTLLNGPWAFVRERPGLRTDGHNVAVHWDASGAGSIDVGIQVVRRFEGDGEVICSATPSGTVARTSHFGPYSDLGTAHMAVREWCRRNGRETATPYWEIYGDWKDDPTKLRTDVLYLLKSAGEKSAG